MKKRLLVCLFVCLQWGLMAQQKTITLKGSETMLPIMNDLKSMFTKDTVLVIIGGGSNAGMKSLMKDSVDMAMVSRNIRTQEKLDAARKGKVLLSVALGKDPLAIVIHPQNAVNNLTLDQIRDIFTGVITNWKALGGQDGPIVLAIRDDKSGTQTFFKEYVLHNEPFAPNAKSFVHHEEAAEFVKNNPNAITFVGISYVNPAVKALAVGYSNEKYVTPTKENKLNRDYPIIRNLYVSYFEEDQKKIQPLLNKALSEQGQQWVKKEGLFPVKE